MHFPKKEVVKFVIKSILQKQKVDSQLELTELVNKELKKVDKTYTISGKRARKIALELPVKISVLTKNGKILKHCPCCGSSLKKIYTRNLAGKRMLFKLVCSKCEYKGLNGKWAPRKYEFWI